MIDTVVLMIDHGYYFVTDRNRFSPSLQIIDDQFIPYTRHVNNPTKQDKERNYYPRLTLIHRSYSKKFQQPLMVEFSAPKLLYGNNLDELTENDFEAIVTSLQARCAEMGVRIFTRAIEHAHITSIHYSKNIQINDGYTATLAIQEIAKLHGSIQQDHNKADFRNEGHAYQIYTKSRSIVLYDKMADINKPKSRAIDKDKSAQQLSLFAVLKQESKPPEILRMEVRYTNRRVLAKELNTIGFAPNLVFDELFNEAISKAVLNHQWQMMYDPKVRFAMSMERKPQATLKQLLVTHPKMTAKQAIELVGMYALARDDAGLLGMRTAIQSLRPKNNWHRLKSRFEAFKDPPFPLDVHGFVDDIERQLNEFKPFRFSVENTAEIGHNTQ